MGVRKMLFCIERLTLSLLAIVKISARQGHDFNQVGVPITGQKREQS
jgi:hypothetical protein